MIAEKAVTDSVRQLMRRILNGSKNILRESTPEESERWRLAHLSPKERESQAQIETDRKHQESIPALLAAQEAEFKKRVDPIFDRLAKREITSQHFQALMSIEIRLNLFTGAAIGAGGTGHLTPDDIARVDARYREEIAYLANWVSQLDRQPNDKERSAEALKWRGNLYGQSAALIASETLDQNHFKEFPALPFYPKQRTLCKRFCACGWQWMNVDRKKGNADVYWRLDWTRIPLEHCETCLNRADAFGPLMIRDFQFVNLPSDLTPYLAP